MGKGEIKGCEVIELRYEHIFEDHMKIAKDRFRERCEREPTQEELMSEYNKLMEYFYE